jgi:hypothetical protein
VAQDESWDIELSISYKDSTFILAPQRTEENLMANLKNTFSDPTSDNDFDLLIDAEAFRELDLGHTCVTLPASPDSVIAGDLATIQVKYIADFDSPNNQTFYACSDVTMVDLEAFNVQVPCFNATEPDDASGEEWDYHEENPVDENDDGDEENEGAEEGQSESGSTEEGSSGGSKKLSGGAIAGIVVGSVAGVALIAAALLFLYRRRQQRGRAARQAASSRGVQWEEQAPGKDSVSNSSVRMQDLPARS